MSLSILLSAAPDEPAADLRRALEAAGYAVAGHALGSAPAVDFAPVMAAVVVAGDRPDRAAAQTRRWRVEHGDDCPPVLWVLRAPAFEGVAAGLDAGADVVMARPVDEVVLAAQVRALARARAAAGRLRARAAEARLLGDRLRAGAGRADRERELARRVRRSLLPAPLVEHGRVRFTVRPGDGGAFVDVLPARAEGVGFYLGEPVGGDPVAGVMVGAVAARGAADAGWDPVGGLLWVNQAVLDLGPDEPPLVAMLAGRIDPETGRLTVARAGLPAPVVLPAKGEPEAWGGPGPFLGVAAASFEPSGRTLGPGDRLVAGTAGAVGLRAAVGRHRALAGEAFLAAVAAELPDPVALLAVEVAAE